MKPPGVLPGITLIPVTNTQDIGIGAAVTYRRIVWYKVPSATVFNVFDLTQPSVAPEGFETFYATGATRAFTDNVPARVGNHGITITHHDFAYQLDQAIVPLAANAPKNYFVQLWPFAQDAAPPNLAAGQYPEDKTLISVKALKKLPVGVIHPSSIVTMFSLQVVNDKTSLPSARFKKLPTPTG